MAPLFSVLKYLTQSKKGWDKLTEEEKKAINPFLIHKYLSMNKNYIDIVNEIQSLNLKDTEKIYKIYLDIIPVSNQFLKFIKSKGEKNDSVLVEHLSKYLGCSYNHAKEYIEILSKDSSEEIYNLLGINEKIKKTKTKKINRL